MVIISNLLSNFLTFILFLRSLSLIKILVNQFGESYNIVGFCLKQEDIKTMQRNIKRAMIKKEFDAPNIRKILNERFMELARVKLK